MLEHWYTPRLRVRALTQCTSVENSHALKVYSVSSCLGEYDVGIDTPVGLYMIGDTLFRGSSILSQQRAAD